MCKVAELVKAFEYGVDYGLLLAEQERDSEDMADRPSGIAQRREPRSKVWREAMGMSVPKFIELCREVCRDENNHINNNTNRANI